MHILYTLYSTPYTVHPITVRTILCTLYSTPYALYPTPAPYTLTALTIRGIEAVEKRCKATLK